MFGKSRVEVKTRYVGTADCEMFRRSDARAGRPFEPGNPKWTSPPRVAVVQPSTSSISVGANKPAGNGLSLVRSRVLRKRSVCGGIPTSVRSPLIVIEAEGQIRQEV